MMSRKYVYYEGIQDMGTPSGLVNYFGGLDEMSNDKMIQFGLFFNGWGSLFGMRELITHSQIGTLMVSHCIEIAPKAIRLYQCLPMFKNLDDQCRYMIVAKSIMKVAFFAFAVTLEHEKSPGGCAIDNYYVITSKFPTLTVCKSFYCIYFSYIFFNYFKMKDFKGWPQVY